MSVPAPLKRLRAGPQPRSDHHEWGQIIALYDTLMAIRPSPVVALNRAIAVAQQEGAARGLEEIRAIADSA